MPVTDAVKNDRDALITLGLLAHAYLTWDPPILAGKDPSGRADFTHFRGLNIQALIVDNADGEVLALEKNRIHEDETPLAHAEQRALHTATARMRAKYPRTPGMTVENWYRGNLFYKDGASPSDFVHKGCTLYTTLEPCPFCAAALCVARMKRVAYLIPDLKFGGAWPLLHRGFYSAYELTCDPLTVAGDSEACRRALEIHGRLTESLATLREEKVQDTWFLDRLHGELKLSLEAVADLTVASFSAGESQVINGRTLSDLKQGCKLPARGDTTDRGVRPDAGPIPETRGPRGSDNQEAAAGVEPGTSSPAGRSV